MSFSIVFHKMTFKAEPSPIKVIKIAETSLQFGLGHEIQKF